MNVLLERSETKSHFDGSYPCGSCYLDRTEDKNQKMKIRNENLGMLKKHLESGMSQEWVETRGFTLWEE